MNTIDEKTFKQGVDEFIGCAPEGGWSDYWAMQQDWEFYKDSLCRDGVITQKQADSWSNPCTPDTFDRWQKRNGLVRRGYESKKPEACKDGKDDDKKNEDIYDRPVTLYASTRYDDAEEAQKFLDSISGGEVKVSKERNGDTLSVSIEGADEDIDAFLAVYKDNYATLEQDCDADPMGWTDPVDLKYYTVQGRKELTGESHKKSEGANTPPTKEEMKRVVDGLKKDKAFSRRYSVADSVLYGAIDSEWSPVMPITDKKTGKTYATILFDGDGKVRINGFPTSPIEGDSSNIDWILEVLRNKKPAESKKSEGIGDRIKMGIDYNMFMRMCGSAAYLDDNEDYWDALWEYYSEMGEIEDACEFFDNLFQYTAWCDADTVYDEYLDDKFKDESKSKEECIQAAIDDGDLNAYKHDSGNYLVIN